MTAKLQGFVPNPDGMIRLEGVKLAREEEARARVRPDSIGMSGMSPYVVRRILTALPTIAIFACFVFLLQKLLPGDPVLAMAGEDRDPATIAALRSQYHLDDPLPLQFVRWAGDALRGNLGEVRSATTIRSSI